MRVSEFREEPFSQATGRLTDLKGQAIKTLRGLLVPDDRKVRPQAARVALHIKLEFTANSRPVSAARSGARKWGRWVKAYNETNRAIDRGSR
jgi:hypothetical protein